MRFAFVLVVVAFLALTAQFSHAEDLTTLDGKKYSDITEISKYPKQVYFTCNSNRIGVAITNLPEEFQEKHGIIKPARLQPTNDIAALFLPIPKLTEADCKNFKEIKAKAEAGDAQAEADLGRCYINGLGTVINESEALKWYRKSAEQGNAAGENGLGWCYIHGSGATKDSVEALKWLHKSDDQGYAKASFNIGKCYENGEGVPQDLVEAVKWYKKSADYGYISSQTKLGICYHDGIGVKQDDVEACKWLELASAHKEVEAEEEAGLAKEMLVNIKSSLTDANTLMKLLAAVVTNSPSGNTSPEVQDASKHPDMEIMGLSTKVMEVNDQWWRWSYQLKVKNNTGESIQEFPHLQFLDAQGFIIEEKTCEVKLSAYETKIFLGTTLVDLPGAARVKSIKVE